MLINDFQRGKAAAKFALFARCCKTFYAYLSFIMDNDAVLYFLLFDAIAIFFSFLSFIINMFVIFAPEYY